MTKQDKPTMKIEEVENKIRKICTYFSEDMGGVGTCGYDLSEKQFQEIFALISTIRREAVEGITEQDMTDTIEAIDTIVNNDWGFDISLKLANKKEFTQEEAVQMGERIMDIYVLVHGFDTQCCKSSKAKLIQKLLSYKKVNNE